MWVVQVPDTPRIRYGSVTVTPSMVPWITTPNSPSMQHGSVMDTPWITPVCFTEPRPSVGSPVFLGFRGTTPQAPRSRDHFPPSQKTPETPRSQGSLSTFSRPPTASATARDALQPPRASSPAQLAVAVAQRAEPPPPPPDPQQSPGRRHTTASRELDAGQGLPVNGVPGQTLYFFYRIFAKPCKIMFLYGFYKVFTGFSTDCP